MHQIEPPKSEKEKLELVEQALRGFILRTSLGDTPSCEAVQALPEVVKSYIELTNKMKQYLSCKDVYSDRLVKEKAMEQRVEQLEKEITELKRQLEERQFLKDVKWKDFD
ncbi:MAG: hypothetical protein H6Q70_475 [Firmicutes bacterium]|nr:hypothetical protein [Bacillota bacterium]